MKVEECVELIIQKGINAKLKGFPEITSFGKDVIRNVISEFANTLIDECASTSHFGLVNEDAILKLKENL